MNGQKSRESSPKKVYLNISIITKIPSGIKTRLSPDYMDTIGIQVLNDQMQTLIKSIPGKNMEKEGSFIVHSSKKWQNHFAKQSNILLK